MSFKMLTPPPARVLFVLFLSLAVFLSGCAASSGDAKTLATTHLSDHEKKEEAEVLEVSRETQKAFAESASFVEDAALENYLTGIAQKLMTGLEMAVKPDFTFKIIREPTVNAMSLLTGHIYFHSGLIARMNTEEEIVFVMAHELGHVYHRDTLYNWMSIKRKTVSYKIASLVLLAPATFVGAGGLADLSMSLMYGSAVQGYGRELEENADAFALEQMLKAGYDPAKAEGFFDIMLADEKKYQKGFEIFFLSDHPANEKRKAFVKSWVEKNKARLPPARFPQEGPGIQDRTYELRLQNVRLNQALGRPYHALEILDALAVQRPSDARVYCAYGDLYRSLPGLRIKIREELSKSEWSKINSVPEAKQNEAWRNLAFENYEKARSLEPALGPVYKGLGEWHFESKKWDQAKSCFEKYLELEPHARDRRSVLRYLQDIQNITKEAVV